MKYIKTLLITLILVFTFTIVKVNAAFLTIDADNTSYDKNTNKFTINGTASFNDVMVGIFDSNNQLISFKTVTSDNNDNYTAVFNIIFNDDQTVIVKVGDIGEHIHELLNVDVEKSANPFIQSLEEQGSGNKLTILDSLKHFKNGDELRIDAIFDLNSLDQDSKDMLSAYQNKLTSKRQIVGIMKVEVYNGNNAVDMPETNNGYKLFLKTDENGLAGFTKPLIARITDPSVIGLEEGKLLKYSSEEGGVPVLLNNTGIYLLIDDLSIEYKFLDNTSNQTFTKDVDDKLVLKIDAELSKFNDLYVDGNKVLTDYYTKKSGSTILTISKDYLNTLAVGKHIILVDYTDGEATTTLTVASKETNKDSSGSKGSNPITSDNIMIYIIALGLAAIGIISILVIKKKKNNK